ncbi:hypothetical protein TKK_0002186 [Trichogramma kaykai]
MSSSGSISLLVLLLLVSAAMSRGIGSTSENELGDESSSGISSKRVVTRQVSSSSSSSTNPMGMGIDAAAQMAAAAAEAAERAIQMGKQVIQGMANGAAQASQAIPGFG